MGGSVLHSRSVMPLIEVYTAAKLPFTAQELEAELQGIWQAKPGVVQVLVIPVSEMSPAPDGLYISIRAKGAPERAERTPEKVKEILEKIGSWLHSRGVGKGKIRAELYESSLQSMHAWSSSSKL